MKNYLKFILTGLGSLALITGSTVAAQASSIGVEPLFLEIAPSQSAAVRVRNTSGEPIPVEVLVFKRDVDAAGKQTRIPADDDFIIFPPQASIKGSATQVFRLRPIDAGKILSESYYISFRQVPAPLAPSEQNGARLQVVFSFDAAVHVVPRKAKGEAVLKATSLSNMILKEPTGEVQSLKNGRKIEIMRDVDVAAIEIEIENSGNKYLYLHEQEFSATVTDTSGETSTHKWVSNDVSDHVTVTLVEPQEARKFKLPLPKGIVPRDVDVSVRQRQEF